MSGPVLGRANIAYELSARTKATAHGGIGAIAKLIDDVGLAGEIDASLQLLKLHKPYYESDHVLNIAYNALCGGQRLQDIEARRCDAVFLDGLGTESLPDPTTAGDFCRRFDAASIIALQEAVNRARLKVWRRQPDSFFEQPAVIDADAIDRAHRRADQAGHGHLLQRHLGVLGAGRLAREHQRTLVSGAVGRQPAQPRGRDRLLRPGDRPVPPGRVHGDPPAGRHRLLAHHRVRPLGRPTACGSSSATTPRPT